MDMLFNESEIRVLSSLVEKAVTTPDNYPLTLNALINACNQKSNRDPMTAYTGQTVGAAIDSLKQRGLIRVIMGGDSRVPKYREYFAEAFSLAPPEAAVLCELMLRGPQTSGELRGRIERFGVEIDVQEVETILGKLMARAEPLVVKLPLRPGRKEARYAHLLAGQPTINEADAPLPATTPSIGTASERLARLEEETSALREELAALQQQFAAFKQQFE